jgi:Na+-transporting methylmalonyl-CoA/oxaloacetate decarboxylase gamma subunit
MTRSRARPRRDARPAVSFTLLGAMQITLIAAITVVAVALPAIQRELHAGGTDLIFVGAAYGVSFGGLLLLGGHVADLFGHRRVFLAGTAVFGLASAAAALAPGLATLVAARFAQGAGAAFTAPAAMALAAADHTDPRRRRRALAVWGVLASIGATTGNALSGVALTWMSWRWVLALPALVSLAVLAAGRRLVPPGPPPARAKVDVLGAVLVTAGLSLLIFGLGRLDAGWIAGGAALLAAFGVVQRRGAAPLVPPALVAAPRRLVALLGIALTAAGMTVVFFLLALYYQQVRGYSPLLTSAAFAPPAALILGTGPVAAWAVARLAPATVAAFGLAAAAAGLGLLAGLHADTGYLGRPLAGLVVFAAGAGLTFGSAMVAAAQDAPHAQEGLVAGIANTAMEAGPPVGLAVLVPLAAAHSAAADGPATGAAATAAGYGYAFAIAALAFAVTAALTFGTERLLSPRLGAPAKTTRPAGQGRFDHGNPQDNNRQE